MKESTLSECYTTLGPSLVRAIVAHTVQQLAHHTVSMETRVALTVIDVCLTVGAGKSDHTCALISIDNVLWNKVIPL